MVTDTGIAEVLRGADGDCLRACDDLVARALEGGGNDNITVVVMNTAPAGA